MFETEKSDELSREIARGKCVVLFYASWCPDCHRFMPVFDAAAEKSRLPIIKARTDADENPIWDDFKIEVVPTVVLFENGKEKMRAEERGKGVSPDLLKKMLG